VDSSKTQDMLNWNTPASVPDIHILLRMVGYYWKFVEGFQETRKPMTELFGMNDRVHGVVDQRHHGPWWTMDRGATRSHRSMSSPALWGSAPCHNGTGSKRAVRGTYRRAHLG
jgi:hypothetical protein